MLVVKDYELGRARYSSKTSNRLAQDIGEFGPISAAIRPTWQCAVQVCESEISDKSWPRS